jgi:hypothetical protein
VKYRVDVDVDVDANKARQSNKFFDNVDKTAAAARFPRREKNHPTYDVVVRLHRDDPANSTSIKASIRASASDVNSNSPTGDR